jgi:hypothetical protein
MFRPLIRTTAWVYAFLWVLLGPLNILIAFTRASDWLLYTVAYILQFAVGYYLLRYLWRSSWPSRQETVRLGESDAPKSGP